MATDASRDRVGEDGLGLCTHLELRNGYRYPCINIVWKRDRCWAGGGWTGTLTVWLSGSEKDARTHTVGIGQSAPLGHVSVSFDDVGHGAWTFASFEGTGVTERDLQWATLWAALALKSRRTLGDLNPLPLGQPSIGAKPT